MNTETTNLPIALVPVEGSKQIAALGFADGVLAIEFQPRAGEAQGSVYHYQGVTPDLYAAFVAAQSKGNYFYNHIKNDKEKYPFTRVRDPIPEARDASEPGREAA